MTRPQLNAQLLQILDLAPEREERFAEIIDQDDADGAINYWLGCWKFIRPSPCNLSGWCEWRAALASMC